MHLSIGLFGFQVAVVLAAAWGLNRWLNPSGLGLLELLTGWILCAVALIVTGGMVLGHLGWLSAIPWLGFNLLVLTACFLQRRGRWSEDKCLLRQALTGLSGVERRLLIGIGLFLLGLGGMAASAEPLVYDALAIRLPRIGCWLQEGRICQVGTADPRLDYMPYGPDLLMAWLIGPFEAGWRPAVLTQWLGGCLLLVSTAGLARMVGLSRLAALGAAGLAGGLANVAPQFVSAHSDLFTAGVLAAGFFLWWRALTCGAPSVLGGIGAGLALGSKGTVFYLAPALLCWVIFLGWRARAGRTAWRATVLAGLVAVLFFAGPNYLSNWRQFGGPFGPADHVAQHHAGGFFVKIAANLPAMLLQLFDPASQPLPLGKWLRDPALLLAEKLDDSEALTWMNYRRQSTLRAIFQRERPDADVTSFGILPVLSFLAAAAIALRRASPHRHVILAFIIGLGAAYLFFAGMQRWHPFGYRYMVLAAPWFAVCMAWGLENAGRRPRHWGWATMLLAALTVFTQLNLTAYQTGWTAIVKPQHISTYSHMLSWAKWSAGLVSEGTPLAVALPYNRPLAAFFRQPDTRPIKLLQESDEATAELAARQFGGWIIVPAAQYLGREGSVLGRTWLDAGDETSPFSLAAYRLLRENEPVNTILYRCRADRLANGRRWSLLIRPPSSGLCQIVITNPGPETVRLTATTPSAQNQWTAVAGQNLLAPVALATGQVSEVVLLLTGDAESASITLDGQLLPFFERR